ncbi:unnamed protein product [Cylindrotheca closterium]|uniref:Phosphodiesterase n=1 Tax=Cylindrotheca closterium TaxID=2856 RepID=A0AAD2FQY4_9STRA|nr:unnamed protein product [Cylindrotheca closterium]
MVKEPSVDGRSFGSWDDILSETVMADSNNDDEVNERMEGVGKRETRQLEVFKTVFLGLLLVATVLISWTVYSITESGEDAQFENHFHDQATRLLQEFSLRFSNAIGAIHSFDVAIISHVHSMNLQWPFALVPEFDIRAESILAISNAKFLTFLVKVTAEADRGRERPNFEAYVQNHSDWVEQAYDRLPAFTAATNHHNRRQLQGGADGSQGNLLPSLNMTLGTDNEDTTNTTAATGSNSTNKNSSGMVDTPTTNSTHGGVFPTLFTFEEDNKRTIAFTKPEYHPVFQCHPVAPNLINYNLESHTLFGAEIARSSSTRSIVVGQMVLPEEEVARSTTSSSGDNNDGSTIGTNTNNAIIPSNSDNNDGNIYDHSTSSPMTQGNNNNNNRKLETVQGSSTSGLYSRSDPYIEFIHQQQPDSGPFSQVILPIFEDFWGETSIVGFVAGYFFWSDFIADQLPDTVTQVIGVLENECGQVVSFEVNSNKKATYLGEGDFHNPSYDDLETSFRMQDIWNDGTKEGIFSTDKNNMLRMDLGYCPYTIKIYPSQVMDDSFDSNRPYLYMFLVMGMFIVTCCTFFGYDFLHERRNKVVMTTARQTQKIVSSLFPAVVRDRLLEDVGEVFQRGSVVPSTPRVMLRSYLNEGEEAEIEDNKPIADLFPATTIMFADIAGFTAWSSLREPAQVFTLLETIYGQFDQMAKRQQVFKVETIGDCYVAVTGLPDPQPDHAVIMAKFANHCLTKFAATVKNLEKTLGPDTSDLGLRIGLHSGPVTAGVLRGEKSRFQLFGDTMNTASRMESTSKSGRIQCSEATAKLLKDARSGNVLIPRSTTVDIKGKGLKQTYWIKLTRSPEDGTPVFRKSLSEPLIMRTVEIPIVSDQVLSKYIPHPSKIEDTLRENQRLIDWHVEMLSRLLKQVVGSRKRKDRIQQRRRSTSMSFRSPFLATPMSELTEIVEMPKFDKKKAKKVAHWSTTEVPLDVQQQLRVYISTLACMYKGDNPFHNFAHASHVTMASNKLLSRVVTPDDSLYGDTKRVQKGFHMRLHDYTYGLTSDPTTQFAIVFSALVHDVDHRGVSNSQLVKEETEEALKYSGKSVAEQHSIDIAWQVLMDPSLERLRQCLYSSDEEYQRFRQLVVNCVIATDIFDKGLKDLRNKRWEMAFHQHQDDTTLDEDGEDDEDENFNRRATIVIEHIIQAADVSHTMQHWLVYQKWNERLFQEMYQAYVSGRGGEKDPSIGWYNGELWFFDNYVIPLAKKLEECGVFGVSSAECLDYALENREQWQKKGEEIVEGLRKKYCGKRHDLKVQTSESSLKIV